MHHQAPSTTTTTTQRNGRGLKQGKRTHARTQKNLQLQLSSPTWCRLCVVCGQTEKACKDPAKHTASKEGINEIQNKSPRKRGIPYQPLKPTLKLLVQRFWLIFFSTGRFGALGKGEMNKLAAAPLSTGGWKGKASQCTPLASVSMHGNDRFSG